MIHVIDTFILSQILVFIAICFDFLSMQFKERKHIYSLLTISALLISSHLFLLEKLATGIIVLLTAIRFIVCIFSTNKLYLYLFLLLNTIVLLLTSTELFDIVLFLGMVLFITGNFQNNKKLMRKQMMAGTTVFMTYYILIFSPMAILAEFLFLIGQVVGYYKHYLKKDL